MITLQNLRHNHLINDLAYVFRKHGKTFYVVGGSVRDTLLGRMVHDIDCATDALPDEIKLLVTKTNPLRVVPIGEKFGTIQVHYPAQASPLPASLLLREAELAQERDQDDASEPPVVIEITTFRGERYTPGSRHPEVQFGTSLIEDLRRRDFTINAMAIDPFSDEIIDPFEGQLDLPRGSHAGFIRAVEDPDQRFAEDPLRMLRAVRLAAQLEFLIAMQTCDAIGRLASTIEQISKERVRDELAKILLAANAPYGLFLLKDLHLLTYILPEVEALAGVEQPPHHQLDVFEHTLKVVELVPQSLVVRLAALLHDIAKPATKSVDEQGHAHFYGHEDVGAEMAAGILRRLRFGNDVVAHVAKTVKLHMRVNAYTEQWSNGAVRRLFLDADNVLDDLLALAIADGTSDRHEPEGQVISRIAHLRARMAQVEGEARVTPLISPLDGNVLMAHFGRPAGPWIGMVKQHLSNLVIEGTLQADDMQAAIAAAETFLKTMESE